MKNEDSRRMQLEQVTALGGEPADGCDAQTRRLRETWIALGNLLEAASIEAPIGQVEPVPTHAVHKSSRFSHLGWAIAASVLFVPGLAAWFGFTREQSNEQSPPLIASGPQQKQQIDESEVTPDIDPETIAWDDSLDGELVSLSQAASSLQTSWPARSTRLTAVGEALEEIEQEIQQGTF
jgi:hypothetical protein